jgi:hypothetical protein
LLDRDRAVLDDWGQREVDALAERGWRRPEPLAVGAAARELVARAEQRNAPLSHEPDERVRDGY